MRINRNALLVTSAIIVIIAFCKVSYAQNSLPQVSLYDDPRVVSWSKDFLASKREEVIRSVEQDLKSASPHPFAPHVWTFTQNSLGRLEQMWPNPGDAALQKALGEMPEIFLLYKAGARDKLLERYPPSKAAAFKDPQALLYLYLAAADEFRYQDGLTYMQVHTKLYPELFQTVWGLSICEQNDDRVWLHLADSVKQGGDLANTRVGRALRILLSSRPTTDQMRIVAARAWFADSPHDARALRFLANQLKAVNAFENALDYYRQSTEVYPFGMTDVANWEERAEILLRLGRDKEAQDFITRNSELISKDSTAAELLVARNTVSSNIRAGEKGAARRALEVALKRFPEDAYLLDYLANLELSSNKTRYSYGLSAARKAAQADPQNESIQRRLVEAVEKVEGAEKAFMVWKDIKKRFPKPSLNFYYQGSQLLESLKRNEDRVRLCEEAVRVQSDSWFLREYADALNSAGRNTEALDQLKTSLTFTTKSNWVFIKLREWTINQQGNTKAGQSLQEMLTKYPWVQKLWQDAVQQLGDGKIDEKLALWRQAIEKNPGAYWPWSEATNMLFSANKLEDARSLAGEAMAALKRLESPNAVNVYSDFIWGAIRKIRNGTVTASDLQEALKDLDSYKNGGGNLNWYNYQRATILLALGKKQEAWQSALTAAQINPENSDYFWFLFNGDFGDERKGRWLHVRHYWDRDPYDGKRFDYAAQTHIRWGGSAIVGYQLQQLCRKNDPDNYSKSLAADALGNLGASADQFKESYGFEKNGVGPSDRYILWYDTARSRAQQGSSTVKINLETGVAEITHPDGIVERRKDHPISGKPELIQVGQAYITLEYDPRGENLEHIKSSSGQEIRMTYDAMGRIVTLVTSDGEDLSFQYNDLSKPVVVSVKGVGEITIKYTPDGEIEKIDSSAGRSIALKITSSVQKLLNLIEPFKHRNSGMLPDLPLEDPMADKLRDAVEEARSNQVATGTSEAKLAAVKAQLTWARYMVDHLGDKRRYAFEAHGLIRAVFEESSEDKDSALFIQTGDTIGLWHELMIKTRLHGLSAEDWAVWASMRKWLDSQLNTPGTGKDALFRVSRKIDEKPLELLPNAMWMPSSYIDIDGYWRRIDLSSLIPKHIPNSVTPTSVLIRSNHQEIIGTSAGLIVWQNYWRWLAFDEDIKQLSSDLSPARINSSSQITAMAEDASGTLWIGTANGLLRVDDSYSKVTRWTAGPDGLPVPGIDCLAALGNRIFIGTQRGLRIFADGRFERFQNLVEEQIIFLRGPEDSKNGDAPLLIGTPSGVFALVGSDVIRISQEPAEDALWSQGLGKIFLLRGLEVYSLEWDGKNTPGEPKFVRGQQNIHKSNRVYGLAKLSIDKEVEGIAVLTDLGLSVYYNDHFEYKKLPLSDSIVDVRRLSSLNRRALMISTGAVYALDRGRVMGDNEGRVYDILTADDLGLTFIARGSSLQIVRQESPESGAKLFDGVAATHLARHPDGSLITNDGLRIIAYDRGSTHARELFDAYPTIPSDVPKAETADTLTSLLVASDGTIWVTAGPSVFRYKGGKAEEFNIFSNPDKFPAQCDMISRVIETVDGRILVVASSEGHRAYKGMPLNGGILQWIGNSFKRIEVDRKNHTSLWFITGYTPIDQRTAIVATCSAFARESDGRLATFPFLKDASYQNLSERMPMLWLGTKGARLGKDLWLFGCAGGIVAYRDGQWFYPDRLNWMLPDQHLSQYGARTVHTIATDKNGFIYAGTDRGLMVYDSGGGDVAAFMITNDRPDIAYTALEQSKLQREAEILLQAIKPGSELANRVEKILQGRSRIEELKNRLSSGMSARILGTDDATPTNNTRQITEEESKRLKEELDQRLRAQTQLLLELERDNRSLYQMLEFPPLVLRNVRDRISAGDVIVQYLPTKNKLYIQVITRDEPPALKEVEVGSADLFQRARIVASTLARGGNRGPEVAKDAVADTKNLNEDLAWLYDNLLRPIEANLKDSRHVFIIPIDALSYLPFGALVSSKSPKVEYAIQKYVFGYLPSLYLFDLMSEEKRLSSHDALVVGDPDGSLPGARKEAGDVKAILGGGIAPLIGKDATYDNFVRVSPSARYLHLATHGYLDDKKPEQSYLLMANGYRLSVVDICTMQSQFAEADLAVLSACETGRGKEGMEYATLARAFATAKVPSIVATLWRINDAKSPEIIKMYYGNMAAGDDRLTALAKAQREMIAGDKDRNNPSIWSSFIVFGKP
jgi:YD repeat-containing protein